MSSVTSACLFDQLIEGTLPSHTVLEEDGFVAFLDNRPVFDGHTLVVPRAYYGTLAETPDELLGPCSGPGDGWRQRNGRPWGRREPSSPSTRS